MLNKLFNVALTVLLKNVLSSVRSLARTDRNGPCHHTAFVAHANREKRISILKETNSKSRINRVVFFKLMVNLSTKFRKFVFKILRMNNGVTQHIHKKQQHSHLN